MEETISPCGCELEHQICQYDPSCRARPQMTSYYDVYVDTCTGAPCGESGPYCGCP